jgi:hypothetical protein
MILLLSVSPLGQAGVNRLHPTLRRIRRHKQRLGSFAPLNKQVISLCFAFIALPFSERRRLRNPGLKSEPMYNWGKLTSHLLAAAQSGGCAFSSATAVSQVRRAETQSPRASFLNDKPTYEKRLGNREWRTRSGRNSICFIVSLGTGPVPEALDRRPIALIYAFHETCFSRVARQPQQPVVEALETI